MHAQKTSACPANLLFVDTETKSTINPENLGSSHARLWFGWAYACRLEGTTITREKWCRFETPEEFWEFARARCDQKRPLYVFAHNLGFDLTILDFWQFGEVEGMVQNYIVLEDPPTFMKVTWNGCPVNFIDTLNYWRSSLAELGESVQCPKLEMPRINASKEKWDEYGKNDVKVITKAVLSLIEFIREYDLGNFAISQASLAMNAFRRKFMRVPIYIHDNYKALELERESYHGGLVHCFHIGQVANKKLHCLDVNSLYPYCMLQPVPTKILRRYRELSVRELRLQCRNKGSVARVKIASDVHTFPIHKDNRLLEARGTFTTVLAGPELARALETNSVVKCYEAAFYETNVIFDEYVNFFFGMRQKYSKNIDPTKNHFFKILLNSLYGKFAQNAYEWRTLDHETIRTIYADASKSLPAAYSSPNFQPIVDWGQSKWFPMELGRSLQVRFIGGELQVKYQIGEHGESFPLISSYITAYAREHLRMLIGIAGIDSTYYCDTDSLFVDNLGLRRLKKSGWVDEKKLGHLKYEGESNEAIFYGPKDYCFGSKLVTKGISSRAINIGPGEYIQNQFEGIKSVLKRKPEPYIDIRWVVKQNKREYKKGNILASGRVEFFHLNEPDWEDLQANN